MPHTFKQSFYIRSLFLYLRQHIDSLGKHRQLKTDLHTVATLFLPLPNMTLRSSDSSPPYFLTSIYLRPFVHFTLLLPSALPPPSTLLPPFILPLPSVYLAPSVYLTFLRLPYPHPLHCDCIAELIVLKNNSRADGVTARQPRQKQDSSILHAFFNILAPSDKYPTAKFTLPVCENCHHGQEK